MNYGRQESWGGPVILARSQKRRKVFQLAKGALEALWHARGGGPVAYGLAVMTAAGVAAESFWPEPDQWQVPKQLGLQPRYTPLLLFIANALQRRGDGETVAETEKMKTMVWRTPDGVARVALVTGDHRELFAHPEGGDAFLTELMQDVWSAGRELIVLRSVAGFESRMSVSPMDEPGPFIGAHGPEWLAQRLQRYPEGPRTILLRGRSGVGKSVLARRVCRLMGGEDFRLLKVPSSCLIHFRDDEVLDLIRLLRPDMLLLDDVNIDAMSLDHMLSLFETMRAARSLVFVTMMTDGQKEETDPKRGAFHTTGMRPGRIDEVHHLALPDESERRSILAFYAGVHLMADVWVDASGWDRVAQATEGLSGAYLAALIERMATHGATSWKEELEQIMLMAPEPDGQNVQGASLSSNGVGETDHITTS